MDRDALLPDRCVKCNEPALGHRQIVKLSHSPIDMQVMFGALGSLLFAKRAEVAIGLCEKHRHDPRRVITPGLVALAALLGMFAMVGFVRSIPSEVGVALLFGLVAVFVVAAFIALIRLSGGGSVRATKITATHLWLKSVGAPFLASLPPPPVTTTGVLPSLAGSAPADPTAEATNAYRTARTGAIVFAAGCLITAGSYLAAPGGRFLILWGLAVAGLVALARGLGAYAKVPAEQRQRTQITTLAAILALGLIAGGWVIVSQVKGSQDDAALTAFGAAMQRAAVPHQRAVDRFDVVMQRTGVWSAQDSADMNGVASDYGEAADILGAAPITSELAWYREGMVRNLREAQEIATQLSLLGASPRQSALDALLERWRLRVKAYDDLQKRLEAQGY